MRGPARQYQVGSRLGAGLTTLPCYKHVSSRGKPNCHYLGGLKHHDASMINLSESRGEARVRKEKTTPKNNMEENGGDNWSVGIGWERATRLAQDKAIWRDLVDALCPTRSQLFKGWIMLSTG